MDLVLPYAVTAIPCKSGKSVNNNLNGPPKKTNNGRDGRCMMGALRSLSGYKLLTAETHPVTGHLITISTIHIKAGGSWRLITTFSYRALTTMTRSKKKIPANLNLDDKENVNLKDIGTSKAPTSSKYGAFKANTSKPSTIAVAPKESQIGLLVTDELQKAMDECRTKVKQIVRGCRAANRRFRLVNRLGPNFFAISLSLTYHLRALQRY